MAFHIDAVTESHAEALSKVHLQYEDEGAITFPNGGAIRYPAYPSAANYVRLTDDDGRELMYWNIEELAEEPAEVLGAILGFAYQVANYSPENATV